MVVKEMSHYLKVKQLLFHLSFNILFVLADQFKLVFLAM